MKSKLIDGEKLFADGQIDAAERCFLDILEENPKDSKTLNNLGVIRHVRGNMKEAEDFFIRALTTKEDYSTALVNLANVYYVIKDWEKAAGTLEKCTSLSNNEPNIYNQLGTVYLEMGKTEKARQALSKSIEINPEQDMVRASLETLENKGPASTYSPKQGTCNAASKTPSVSIRTSRKPTVSIGMPVYNMENTVQEAIDTVLNQTFSDFQLIISDNASDDGTEEICRAAARQDSRVIYHRNPVNILAENFRLTFLLSTGKYFMWAAADDSRRPEMVSRCVEALDADPKAVLAYTHTELIDPATGTRRKYFDSYRLDQEDPAERYISLVRYLDLGNAIYGLYRSSVLHIIPPLSRNSPQFIPFNDTVYLTNVVFQGKVIQIPEMLFVRRRGKSKAWLDHIAFVERCAFPNYLTNGVTLPVSESIQEHVRDLMTSTLPVETKLRLTQITYEAYVRRYGDALSFEIDRAVQLAKAGRFTETWNGMPAPHPDEKVQNHIDQIYAGLLLDRLDRTSRFIKYHQGLHLGKAFCLAKMGRRQEAELEHKLELSKGLTPRKPTQKLEVVSAVSHVK